ncbi:MAG: DUF4093 domain-containing protein [Oscillospiraceae bacterium]
MDKLKIKEAIVVEGRYDKNTLSQLVDTLIVETAGFGIFHNDPQLSLLRQLAETRGLIVLTDSDGAGFVIRNYLKGAIDPALIKHAYIPDIYGKERRKASPGKEGKLGVEGMRPAVLEEVLRRAGATFLEGQETKSPSAHSENPLTKADLYALGLTGRPDSKDRRQALQTKLNLPEHLSCTALLAVLNSLYTPSEVAEILSSLPS